jgi:DNA helicase HerA-like ATPase
LALPPERQDQQNVGKLRSLPRSAWGELVELIYREGNGADLDTIRQLLKLDKAQEFEAIAARSNMTAMVRMLHDPASQMLDMLLRALADGKLCILDVSQLRGGPSLVLSGLILRTIFDHNQQEFTKAHPRTISTIAVVEEAQSVLNEKASAAAPYVEWVKEGRKYRLGALLITQQPGSIPTELLSQGDNWFIFHLLSGEDLANVRRANAHFSEDILSSLLNEPIAGQGVFWSGVSDTIFPRPLRVLSFGLLYRPLAGC